MKISALLWPLNGEGGSTTRLQHRPSVPWLAAPEIRCLLMITADLPLPLKSRFMRFLSMAIRFQSLYEQGLIVYPQ